MQLIRFQIVFFNVHLINLLLVNMKMRIWILCTEIMKFSPSFTRNILLICEFWMRLVSRPSTRPRASPMELSGSTRELTTCCCRGSSSDRRSMDATVDTSLVIELVTPCFVKNMPGRGSRSEPLIVSFVFTINNFLNIFLA